MSLMLKLLVTISVLSSFVYADDAQVVSFLQKGIGSNPNIVSLDINVVDKIDMEKPKGWKAYVVELKGKAKRGDQEQPISQRSIYFVGDGLITSDLYDLKSGQKINSSLSPTFKEKYYDKAHLLFGNADAAHKVVIFSDPLCPFCRSFVPEALVYMKPYPKTFAVYYYHFPLSSLHPAAVPLVKAAIAAELLGEKDVVTRLYKVEVNGRETNQQKILDAFNSVAKTKLTLKEITTPQVEQHLAHDLSVAQEHLVNGTPTIFIDGKMDPTKAKYKKVKLIK